MNPTIKSKLKPVKCKISLLPSLYTGGVCRMELGVTNILNCLTDGQINQPKTQSQTPQLLTLLLLSNKFCSAVKRPLKVKQDTEEVKCLIKFTVTSRPHKVIKFRSIVKYKMRSFSTKCVYNYQKRLSSFYFLTEQNLSPLNKYHILV